MHQNCSHEADILTRGKRKIRYRGKAQFEGVKEIPFSKGINYNRTHGFLKISRSLEAKSVPRNRICV